MNAHYQLRMAALAGAMVLVVSACGGDDGGSDPMPPPPPPPTALELATSLLATVDQRYATALPANGAELTASLDGCYLGAGATKAFLASNYDDTGPAASGNIYSKAQSTPDLGSKRSNVQVLGERVSTNADGSQRREIDIEYDIAYTDGTKSTGVRDTLLTGSSSGSCAMPQSSDAPRFFGNRELVNLGITAHNQQTATYSLVDGSARSPNFSYRRDVLFGFLDPGQLATYMIVTGPGPNAASGKPFGLKLLSPRLVRNAPELAGKPGTFDLGENDGFLVCSTPTGATQVPDPATADCVGSGVQGANWGSTLDGPVDAANTAAADARFAAQGWVAGGVYTVAVHADDGWKTINGQSGKTPLATYQVTLKALPYTFAQMQTPPAAYPTITNSSLTLAQIAEAARTTGGVTQLTWDKAQPPAGGKPLGLVTAFVFGDGAKTGSTTGFPSVRDFAYFNPALNATTASVPFTGRNPATIAKRYQGFSLFYSDRQGHAIQHTTQFF